MFIKFFLFFFNFNTYFTVNALFFTEATIHKIYIDNGTYDFIYHLPKIIYSFLISWIINAIIKQLALSQKNFIELKQIKSKENLDNKGIKILRTLNIKFVYFFIITFIFSGFYWYYITCFCGIYINTQIILIKNALISFGFSLIYPFGFYLIPGIFRLSGLRYEKDSNEYLYQISLLFQML